MPIKKESINRRDFAKILGFSGATGALTYFGGKKLLHGQEDLIEGAIVGGNWHAGHLLRAGITEIPSDKKQVKTVIVGGGMSGLSAAWKLKQKGYEDFLLLELDKNTGGNSQFGENSVSRYPWGAHYIPVPNLLDKDLLNLFEELNIITGYNKDLPVINDYYLCATPEERLFFQGKWQDGLVPMNGVTDEDKKQYQEFFAYIESLKGKKGKDQKYIFSIPLEISSQDNEFLELDKKSMEAFMHERGWASTPLNWYVNYCCRDDFGVSHSKVSAWAGLHYFCSRNGKCANAEGGANITWPEGNGWVAEKLKNISQDKILCDQLVYHIEETPDKKLLVDVFDISHEKYTRYEADHVIYCAPRFTASHIIKHADKAASSGMTYSPWLCANVTLENKPDGEGHSLSWDNVSYYSSSLGYVVATHQNLKFNQKQTVITYYLPLDEMNPAESRSNAFSKDHKYWTEKVLTDLETFHTKIRQDVKSLDVWIWGHGMISPGIGFLWSEQRKKLLQPLGNIHFAHTDMSGISIFEEAFYRGCRAAEAVLKRH